MHFYEDTLSVWDGHVCFKSRFNAYLVTGLNYWPGMRGIGREGGSG